MEALKKDKKSLKARITRICNWVSNNKDSHDTQITDQFQVKKDLLKQYFSEYDKVLQRMEALDESLISDDPDEEESKSTLTMGILNNLLRLPPNTLLPSTIQVVNRVPAVKLQELSQKPFSGDFSEWNSFFQLFTTLFINNSDLNDLQKFIHLKQLLRGEPLALIDSIEVLDVNFIIALDTLRDRYENKARITSILIKRLIKIPSLVKSTTRNLRNFLTQSKQTIKSLENMNVPIQHWDLILIELFLEKLDFQTHKAFEYEVGPKNLPTIKQFFDFLEKRCDILEKMNDSDSKELKSSENSKKLSHFTRSYPGQAGLQTPETHSQNCLYCKDSHKIYQCNNFKALSPQDKFRFVTGNNLCRNCFGNRHLVDSCTSERTCSVCKRKHHTWLHNDNFMQDRRLSYQGNSSSTQTQNQNLRFTPSTHNSQATHSSQNQIQQSSVCTQVFQARNQLRNPESTSQSHTQSSSSNVTSHSTFSRNKEILLATALVTLYSKHNKRISARALLDNGSQVSFISQELVNKLKYRTYNRKLKVSTISQNCTVSHQMIDVDIYPFQDLIKKFKVSCAVQDVITCNLPQVQIDRSKICIPQNIQLADPSYSVPGEIDLLLGADIYSKILKSELIKLGKGLPTLQNTELGYLLFGELPPNFLSQRLPRLSSNLCTLANAEEMVYSHSIPDEISLDKTLERFWNIEQVHPHEALNFDLLEERAEQIFKDTIKILPNGRYQVNLPLITPTEYQKLGDSFQVASKRFFSLENKLLKNEYLYSQYKDFIKEYLSLNHAKVVPLTFFNEKGDNKYFLPHHCVIRNDSLTTKLRVVFDGSMNSSTGVSLNNILLKGYTTQPDLFDILIRFRTFLFACSADIQKMFRQILINPQQTFLQNILWRNSPKENLQCIELKTVTYGTNCAPFLSTRCLKELAIIYKESFPLASDALLNSCYMDDILYGTNDLQTLFEAYREITELLEKACISLHKWCSNSLEFIRSISDSSLGANYVISPENKSNKVLGLLWNSQLDYFSVYIPDITLKDSYTKREVLSLITQIFDPIGLINPITVVAKIIMQNIWLSKIGWDESLTSEVLKPWIIFLKSIYQLKDLNIPRCVFLHLEVYRVEFHSFSDSSLKAYASCTYLRVIYKNGQVSCILISSKSRVSPIKNQLTIPKLELMGFLLSARLTQKIVNILQNKISFDSINLWTDSEIVLAWLGSHASRWIPWVGRRVAEIHEISHNYEYRYVKSKDNPADILSRGMLPNDLIDSQLWWHGPNFLKDSNVSLTKFNPKSYSGDIPEERKVSHFSEVQDPDFFTLFCQRFSSFTAMQRTVARILRFSHNSRNFNTQKLSGPLTVTELQVAEIRIVKLLQEKYFYHEISKLKSQKIIANKAILSLNPFVDSEGMLRVGGRLKNADISFDQKYPFLLPSKNQVVQLMLKREHLRLYHAGSQNTLSNFRLKFWPLNGLREVKRLIHRCLTCFRFKAQVASQIMCDLPKERLTVSSPFTNVGIDYGGPFNIKSSKLRKAPIIKCYIALFVCMVTRAIHIEVVSSLSTEAFLLTLKRFVSRRGNPKIIYSDNATNFVGSCNQLKAVYDFLRKTETSEAIQNFLASSEITWKFIPPRSPHHGGIWEAAIKSTKYHLIRLLGNQNLSYEEFSTTLTQIEAILNSRPISALSNDPSDLAPLTSGHFLIGRPITSFPEKDVSDFPENRLTIWEKSSQIQQLFWKRWKIDYLNRLQNRPKWIYPAKNIEVNDLVLVKDDNTPPLNWPLARVIEVLPGKDNRVRVVKIKTKDGIFTRTISKICPLPS